MRYIFLPFKSSQRRFKHIPTRANPGIVLYHPHGMFSWGFANGGAWNFFYYQKGFQGLVASSLLHAPGFRLLFVKVKNVIQRIRVNTNTFSYFSNLTLTPPSAALGRN